MFVCWRWLDVALGSLTFLYPLAIIRDPRQFSRFELMYNNGIGRNSSKRPRHEAPRRRFPNFQRRIQLANVARTRLARDSQLRMESLSSSAPRSIRAAATSWTPYSNVLWTFEYFEKSLDVAVWILLFEYYSSKINIPLLVFK